MKAEREYDLIPGSSRSSEGTPRPRFGLRNTLELGRVPTPEMGKTASKSKSYFPKSRHHLDRTTVIKPGTLVGSFQNWCFTKVAIKEHL